MLTTDLVSGGRKKLLSGKVACLDLFIISQPLPAIVGTIMRLPRIACMSGPISR